MNFKCLIILILVFSLAGVLSATEVKFDLSCPGNSSTKAGGDWVDFEWNGGCDGDSHDPRSVTTNAAGMTITFQAGDPGGKSNLFPESGDALHNTILRAPDAIGGDLRRNLFQVKGIEAGDYTVDVDGENSSGIYDITSSGPGSWITIFDKTCGLDNFILNIPVPTLAFASAASGELESVTPAQIDVVLISGDPAQTYSIDYSVVGGTATKGDDYTIVEPNTLTFDPGETSKTIDIDIINDGTNEEDETIVLELSNPTGPDVVLVDPNQHTYTIIDPRPAVSFEKDSSEGWEDISPVSIPVSLSFASTETVTVDYEVTGGTATGGGVDYTMLGTGTLTFDPCDTTENIEISVVDDGIDELNETIVISLSNFVDTKPGAVTEHTYTIQDPSQVYLQVDLAVPYYSSGDPIPETAKPGWTIWADGSWADLYMHDFKGIRDIGGSGIDLCIDGGCEGRSGLKCYDMCMFLLNGGGAPTGSPVGDPIANTWYTSVDRCDSVGGSEGSSQLGIAGLPPGQYEVTLYHNLWDPSGRSGRICTANGYSGHAIEKVHAWSIADAQAWVDSLPDYKQGPAGDAHRKMKSFLTSDVNNTNGITPIVEPTNVMPSTTTNDSGVTTSVVEFETDGSPVIIFCHSGTWQSDQYHGDRAPINAFEIKTKSVTQPPTPCGLYEDSIVDWYDLDVFVENWLIEDTSIPLNDADFNVDGKVNFKDYAIFASQWLMPCE